MKEKIRGEYEEPPSVVDTVARCFSAVGIFCREVLRLMDRDCSIHLIHGFGIHRCYFNLLDIRAEG